MDLQVNAQISQFTLWYSSCRSAATGLDAMTRHSVLAIVAALCVVSAHGTLDIIANDINSVLCGLPGKVSRFCVVLSVHVSYMMGHAGNPTSYSHVKHP